MSAEAELDALAGAFGILPEFRDLSGDIRPTSRDTKLALLRANGLALDSDTMIREALAERRAAHEARRFAEYLVVDSGAGSDLDFAGEADWHIELEDGAGIAAEGRASGCIPIPPLPSGVHRLVAESDGRIETVTLLAAPDTCPRIETATGRSRIWGINGALYALRSSRNGGLGDFEDLARAAESFGAHGAAFLGINPVHNIGWAEPGTISPYSPSHRGFLNTAHIATDRSDAPGDDPPELIDYAAFADRHWTALEALYAQSGPAKTAPAGFNSYCQSRGEDLTRFALFEAISEHHGADWRHWPEALKSPEASGVAAVEAELRGRVRFHKWLQWIAESQLAAAQHRATQGGMGLGLYLDLAVGPRRWAAESWCGQAAIATGVSLGAPPDHLSPDGQNWGLAAYAPAKLLLDRFQPLREVLREVMRHAGMLRIDHILGMNRSFWIPEDGSAGGYIRQPFDALLAIVAIEAERSGTVIIGEDLGLVPDGFRETLAAQGLYGYSVLQYERDHDGRLRDTGDLRANSLLCFGTHDTPTMKGFWTSCDIGWWRKLGWIDEEGAGDAQARRERDRRRLLEIGEQEDAPAPEADAFRTAKRNVHAAMAASPAAMVSVQLDDLCGTEQAQNLPGTIDEHPNWRRRCAVPVERFARDLGLNELGATMANNDRCEPRQD